MEGTIWGGGGGKWRKLSPPLAAAGQMKVRGLRLTLVLISSSKAAQHETAAWRAAGQSSAAATAECQSTGTGAEAAVQRLLSASSSVAPHRLARLLLLLMLLRGSRPFAAKVFAVQRCARVDHRLAKLLHHIVATAAAC